MAQSVKTLASQSQSLPSNCLPLAAGQFFADCVFEHRNYDRMQIQDQDLDQNIEHATKQATWTIMLQLLLALCASEHQSLTNLVFRTRWTLSSKICFGKSLSGGQ